MSELLNQGYERHKVQRISESGICMAYVPIGMVQNGLIELPHLGKMTLDHYSSVVQLAALLVLNGFEEITINHTGEADITAKRQGITYAFEYEIKNSHTTEQIIKKHATALEKYNIAKIVCSGTDYPFFVNILSEKNVLKRGHAIEVFVSSSPCDQAVSAV